MDITFSCSKCGQHIVIDQAGAGMEIRCPNCEERLVVPRHDKSLIVPNRPIIAKQNLTPPRIASTGQLPVTDEADSPVVKFAGGRLGGVVITIFAVVFFMANANSRNPSKFIFSTALSLLFLSAGLALLFRKGGASSKGITTSGPSRVETLPLARLALILGLAAIVLFPLGIAAVICGHIALSRIKRANGSVGGRKLAIYGLILGYLGITIIAMIVFSAR